MFALENYSELKLRPVLQRLVQEGYIQNFTMQPYSKRFFQTSYRYPDFYVTWWQGVFMTVAVLDKVFHLDFEILNSGSTEWNCHRDDQFSLSHVFGAGEGEEEKHLSAPSTADFFTALDYKLMQLGRKMFVTWLGPRVVMPGEVYPMMPVRVYETRVEDYAERFSRIAATWILQRNPTQREVLDQLGRLALNKDKVTQHLGERRYTQSSRPSYVEDIEAEEEEERPGRRGVFGSIRYLLGTLEFLDLFGVKYRVSGNKVYTDGPELFAEAAEAHLANKIMNASETQRLILWHSVTEAIQEKSMEDVKEGGIDSEARTLHRKVRKYLAFVERTLGMPEMPLHFSDLERRLLAIPS